MSKEYNTKQKTILINYLKNYRDKQLSINEISEGVKDLGIGQSTVYRQISNLCKDGEIKRFRAEGKSVVYQYVGKDSHCHEHFHLKCSDCGKLIHLDCHEIMHLKGHIMQEHGFNIDIADSILYGKCEVCGKV